MGKGGGTAEAIGVIDALHAAAYEGAGLGDALLGIRDLLGASTLCIARHSSDPDDIEGIGTGFDAFYHHRYITDFRGENLVWNAALELPERAVYHERTLFDPQALRRTAFWNEWMVPQDMDWSIGARIAEAPRGSWLIGIQRSGKAPDFDTDDLGLLALLVPTLRRVLSIRERIGQPGLSSILSKAAMDAIALGMIVVDRQGAIVCANAAAEGMLDDISGGLHRTPQGLAARDRPIGRTLGALIEGCCAPDARLSGVGGYLLVPGTDPATALAVHVGPVPGEGGAAAIGQGPCALVMLRPSDRMPAARHDRLAGPMAA